MRDHERPWAWIDVETTGLDETTGAVLEVGVIVTDATLAVRAERAWTVRYVGRVEPLIAAMHGPGGSGLLRALPTQQVLGADDANPPAHLMRCDGLSAPEVDAMASVWLAGVCGGVAPLWCGRNVAFDRRWCLAHLPQLHDVCHHRSIDETTLRITLAAWAGVTVPKDATATGNRHRALDDLHECLRVARAFRARMAP